jgi:hypothetical protein
MREYSYVYYDEDFSNVLPVLPTGQEEGDFIQTDNGMFDHNLFSLSWGPAVAALSYIFDKVRGDKHLTSSTSNQQESPQMRPLHFLIQIHSLVSQWPCHIYL